MRRNYCRSILLLWYPPSHSLWINLWTCMVSELSCHLWKLPSSGLLHYLWFISVCVGHLSAVFTPSRHCFYFFAACPFYPAKVSHYYRPTSVDTSSVHIVKCITKNIYERVYLGYNTRGAQCSFRFDPNSALCIMMSCLVSHTYRTPNSSTYHIIIVPVYVSVVSKCTYHINERHL